MLFLGETELPADAHTLAAGLTEGLARWAKLPDPGKPVVQVDGENHPDYQRMHIDLSGATTDVGLSTQHPIGIGEAQTGFSVSQFTVVSHPLIFHETEIFADFTASAVRFNFDRDSTNWPVAVLAGADEGNANCRIGLSDLETLLLRKMQPLVAGHGITIESSDLHLQSTGGRTLDAKLRLGLSKQVFLTIHGVVLVTARLEIDDELNAIVRSVGCEGEGAVGSTIAGFAAPYLKRVEGTVVPLSTLPLGEVQMHDVQVHCTEGLHIHGSFSG